MSLAGEQTTSDPSLEVPPGPLRVLLVPSAYYPHVGGIEELTRQLALALRARGHEAAVLTNLWPSGVGPSDVLDGIDISRLRFPLPASRPASVARFIGTAPRAAYELLRHVRGWRPDVVHVIGAGPPSVYLGALRARLGARLVFTTQGELTFDAEGVFDRSATLRVGLRRMLRVADAVTACSAHSLRDLEAFGDIRCSALVIPNGVDPADFADPPPDADDFGRYVLAVGRLVPQKGFDILLDAFGSEAVAGLNLVFAGDGSERESLASQAAALGIGSRVHFLGSVDRARLPRLLGGAYGFVLPSRGEPFGIALLEAMAAGVPAVATAAGGIPEFARNGENALLVPPDDAAALGKAIARIAVDGPLRERLAQGGRKTAGELSWSSIAERYEDVYAAILAGRAR